MKMRGCIKGLIASVFLLLAIIKPVLSEEVRVLKEGSEDYQTILKMTKAYYTAWSYSQKDTVYDQAGVYYSTSPNNVYWDPLPPLGGHRGWGEYKHVIENVWLPAGMVAAGILFSHDGSFQAWRYADVIWTTANCIVHGQYKGGISRTMPCRGTQVWTIEKGKWVIAHEHYSATVNPSGKLFKVAEDKKQRLDSNAEFNKLSDALVSEWSKGIPSTVGKKLSKHYSNELPIRVYMPWAPHDGFQTWSQFEQGLSEYVSLTSNKIEITPRGDLEVTKQGDIAWTTGTLNIDFQQLDNTHVSGSGRQTLIWIKKNDKWLVAHEHLSIPMGGE
ncbi:MAG: nuclear transport factor 2 family protein [Candidatus Thiodiazotropha sp. (ex Lucinoma borealis)]|nr:nuclear transport factor 2 family protein [Candidatus Thiodiazotropha sp. (ex Lucinoma borealis)]MCU7855908.1 nuclear transport factor 2 family protein [Candidatus Thiodiazotropha sp. (ex Lucinoma borealis)]MCU7868542.1 nuclear transport factor 2 family protein [Candidatus Thiodiazotropha sp. (ex Lucinoma borealis)]